MTEDTHKDSNCFALTVICHGNDKGHLLDRNKKRAWITEDIVGDLSEVDNLRGKPKLFVVQACRGSKHHAVKLLLLPATKSRQGNVLHLSVSHSVHRGLCPIMHHRSHDRWSLSRRGVSVQGVSVQWGLCSGVLCLGGLCPGVSVWGGLCLGGLSPGESLS